MRKLLLIGLALCLAVSLFAFNPNRTADDDNYVSPARTYAPGLDVLPPLTPNSYIAFVSEDLGLTYNAYEMCDLFHAGNGAADQNFGAALDADENLWILGPVDGFDDTALEGLYLTKFDGTTWTTTQLNNNTNISWADVKVGPDGMLYGAYVENLDATAGQTDIVAIKIDPAAPASFTTAVIATGDPDAAALYNNLNYTHVSEIGTDCFFVIFQNDNDFSQIIAKVNTSDLTSTVTDTEMDSGSQVSYYITAVSPIAYDGVANVYCVWRGNPANVLQVYYSTDNGDNWSSEEVDMTAAGGCRYPSTFIGDQDGSLVPYISTNFGVGTAGLNAEGYHQSYITYDEGGFAGGYWMDPIPMCTPTNPDPNGGGNDDLCIAYVHRAAVSNGTLVSGVNEWNPATPSGYSARTADAYGDNQTDIVRIWNSFDNSLVGASQNDLVVGSTKAMVVFEATMGEPVPPTFDNYWVKGYNADSNWMIIQADFDDNTGIDPAVAEGGNLDIATWPFSSTEQTAGLYYTPVRVNVNEDGIGSYEFTVRATNRLTGVDYVEGDTISYYVEGVDYYGNYGAGDVAMVIWGPSMVGIELGSVQPVSFELSQNYPNPFNPTTRIEFNLNKVANVSLDIYNVSGQKVETLVSGKLAPNSYGYTWNASNAPSGMYFYQLTVDGASQTQKMILVK
jgi:hypothetical protein